jgi:hypothetical protein
MNKTDTYFVISNYNTIPKQYLEYCNNYIIYDQSTDKKVSEQLENSGWNVSFVDHTGHNLSDYFRYIIDNFDRLPNYIMFLKGNIIGRHLNKEYFDKVYQNKYFTPLYNDPAFKDSVWNCNILFEGIFIELNTNWYVDSKPYSFFKTYNELLKFIFVNPIIPKWLLFSPGACYIIPRGNIVKYPKAFYQNLYHIVSYRFFPIEAYHIERMMQVIFSGNYSLNDYMYSNNAFLETLNNINKGSGSFIYKRMTKYLVLIIYFNFLK